MSMAILKEIRRAVSTLDPGEVEAQAHRRVNIGLIAPDEAGFAELEEFLLPAAKTPPRKRTESSALIHRVGASEQSEFDILLTVQRSESKILAAGQIEKRPGRSHQRRCLVKITVVSAEHPIQAWDSHCHAKAGIDFILRDRSVELRYSQTSY